MKQTTFALIVVLVSAICATSIVGQRRTTSPAKTGKLQGVVVDRNGARIVGAAIVIDGGPVKRQLTSGSEGEFQVQLPAGGYLIRVQANGFRKFELSPFEVKANVTELVNIHMEVATEVVPN